MIPDMALIDSLQRKSAKCFVGCRKQQGESLTTLNTVLAYSFVGLSQLLAELQKEPGPGGGVYDC
jgi:hypothetical protein